MDLPPLPMPGPTPVAFGYVANFRPEKGHHRLIDALELLPAGGWRLDIAGDGVTRPEIQERVARAGMLERVTFRRDRRRREFWRDRHVAMLLSGPRGCRTPCWRAAFAGRAMIATDTGGTPEVVGDGGILVPLDDPRATVAAMQELIGDSWTPRSPRYRVMETRRRDLLDGQNGHGARSGDHRSICVRKASEQRHPGRLACEVER